MWSTTSCAKRKRVSPRFGAGTRRQSSYAAFAAATTGFLQGLQRGAQRRHLFDAALRKCLHVKGYARYALPKEEAKALYTGGWPQLRERLADRALAPVGTAVRMGW